MLANAMFVDLAASLAREVMLIVLHLAHSRANTAWLQVQPAFHSMIDLVLEAPGFFLGHCEMNNIQGMC